MDLWCLVLNINLVINIINNLIDYLQFFHCFLFCARSAKKIVNPKRLEI